MNKKAIIQEYIFQRITEVLKKGYTDLKHLQEHIEQNESKQECLEKYFENVNHLLALITLEIIELQKSVVNGND